MRVIFNSFTHPGDTELEDAEGDADVKGAWRGTGIHPFNPDAVLTKLFGYI